MFTQEKTTDFIGLKERYISAFTGMSLHERESLSNLINVKEKVMEQCFKGQGRFDFLDCLVFSLLSRNPPKRPKPKKCPQNHANILKDKYIFLFLQRLPKQLFMPRLHRTNRSK